MAGTGAGTGDTVPIAEPSLDVFDLHRRVTEEYRSYVESFIRIRADDIRRVVEAELDAGRLCPPPLVQLNPSYVRRVTVDDLARRECCIRAAPTSSAAMVRPSSSMPTRRRRCASPPGASRTS